MHGLSEREAFFVLESRIRNQESRARSQESRIRNRESRIRNQEPRIRNQELEINYETFLLTYSSTVENRKSGYFVKNLLVFNPPCNGLAAGGFISRVVSGIRS